MAEPRELKDKPGTFALRAYVGRSPTGSPRFLHETYVHPRKDGGIQEARRRQKALEVRAQSERVVFSTFGALLDDWLAHARKIGRSPLTLNGYSRRVPVIKAALGMHQLDELSARHLDEWYATMLSDGRSPADIRAFHRIVSAALTQGEKWEMVERNVARRAAPPRVPDPDTKSPPPQRVAELIRLAERSRAPEMASIIFFAAITGMRRGEICALRWHRIEWERGEVQVGHAIWQVLKEIGEKDTKTHQVRSIGIGDVGVALLRARQARAIEAAAAAGVEVDTEGFVWSSDVAGRRPWKPDRMTQAFSRLCDTAEKPARELAAKAGRSMTAAEGWPYRLHDLRHYSAAELLNAGVNLNTVQKRLGHARASTTSDIYGHGREASDSSSADILSATLAAIPAESS